MEMHAVIVSASSHRLEISNNDKLVVANNNTKSFLVQYHIITHNITFIRKHCYDRMNHRCTPLSKYLLSRIIHLLCARVRQMCLVLNNVQARPCNNNRSCWQLTLTTRYNGVWIAIYTYTILCTMNILTCDEDAVKSAREGKYRGTESTNFVRHIL